MEQDFDIEVEDIAYRKIGTKILMARLYRPCGPGPFPAILEVHGGARHEMVLNRRIQRLIDAHHAFWPSIEMMSEGNPQKIIEQGVHEKLPNLLLLQGTKDDNLTPNMAHHFLEAYTRAGGNIILEKFHSQPNAFIGEKPKSNASLKALNLITKFVLEEATWAK